MAAGGSQICCRRFGSTEAQSWVFAWSEQVPWQELVPFGILAHTPHFLYPFSVDGHLGSFHNLAIVDSAALNIGVQVPLCISTPVSLG